MPLMSSFGRVVETILQLYKDIVCSDVSNETRSSLPGLYLLVCWDGVISSFGMKEKMVKITGGDSEQGFKVSRRGRCMISCRERRQLPVITYVDTRDPSRPSL